MQLQTKLEEKPKCQKVTLRSALLTVSHSAKDEIYKESSCALNIRFL